MTRRTKVIWLVLILLYIILAIKLYVDEQKAIETARIKAATAKKRQTTFLNNRTVYQTAYRMNIANCFIYIEPDAVDS